MHSSHAIVWTLGSGPQMTSKGRARDLLQEGAWTALLETNTAAERHRGSNHYAFHIRKCDAIYGICATTYTSGCADGHKLAHPPFRSLMSYPVMGWLALKRGTVSSGVYNLRGMSSSLHRILHFCSRTLKSLRIYRLITRSSATTCPTQSPHDPKGATASFQTRRTLP